MCRQLQALDALPSFHILPSPTRIWARLQAGRASTADMFDIHALVCATQSAASAGDMRRTQESIAAVRCPPPGCICGVVKLPAVPVQAVLGFAVCLRSGAFCAARKAHACFVASLHLLCLTRIRFVLTHWLLTLSSMQVASFSLGTAGAEMATVIQRCKDIECLLADILPPEHVLRQPGQAAHAADSDHAQKLLEDLTASGMWQSCMACLQAFFRCAPATLAKPVDYPV